MKHKNLINKNNKCLKTKIKKKKKIYKTST